MSDGVDYTSLLLGGAVGFLLKALYDELAAPRLRLIGGPEKYSIGRAIGVIESFAQGPPPPAKHEAIRIKVENDKKRILNHSARNCVVWLKLDGVPEKYQIVWVPEAAVVEVNPGDSRYVDLCARNQTTGAIIAPTERGYFHPEPRHLGDGNSILRGEISVTCANGHPLKCGLVISPIGSSGLEVSVEER